MKLSLQTQVIIGWTLSVIVAFVFGLDAGDKHGRAQVPSPQQLAEALRQMDEDCPMSGGGYLQGSPDGAKSAAGEEVQIDQCKPIYFTAFCDDGYVFHGTSIVTGDTAEHSCKASGHGWSGFDLRYTTVRTGRNWKVVVTPER